MQRKTFTLLFLLIGFTPIFAQTIVNNGARIVSQSGSYWVIDNGNFTLKSESATDLVTMANLKIEAGASLTLTPQSYLTVSGALNNGSGTDGLVLQSTAAGTSSLIHETADVNATIQRYITGSTSLSAYTYHFVSVPLTPATNSQSALFMGAYLYEFTPLTNTWYGLGTSTTNTLDETKGYMIYTPEASHTYEFAGPINAGNFSTTVVYAGAGNNLVPNPYPTAIDWDAIGWTKDPAKIANSVYVWPSGGSNYATYVGGISNNGGSNIIPAGQSFIVKAIGASPELAMNDNVRVHSNQAFFKGDEWVPDLLRIKAEANNYTDETVIRFTGNSTAGADPAYDAWKLNGLEAAPQLYSVAADNEKLAINSLPYLESTYTVPLNFGLNTTKTVTLTFSNLESFDASVTIFLKDHLTGQLVNLRNQPEYSFHHNPENAPSRFTVLFGGAIGVEEPVAQHNKMWIYGHEIYILSPDLSGSQALVEVFNVAGQTIYSKRLTLSEVTVLNTGSKGFVTARLISDGQIITCKGIIN